MPYANEFFDLQTAVINRLTAVDATVPAPVANAGQVTWINEKMGDLVNRVQQATAKLGIVGLVLTPGGDRLQLRDPETGQLSFVCPVQIQIQENVMINQGASGTQIHALDLVKFCMKRLNLWDPKRASASDRGKRSPTALRLDPKPFELVNVPNEKDPLLAYDVRFNAPISIL